MVIRPENGAFYSCINCGGAERLLFVVDSFIIKIKEKSFDLFGDAF